MSAIKSLIPGKIKHSMPYRGLHFAKKALLGTPKDSIYFIHLSKTAGSHIKNIISEINSNRNSEKIITLHDHDVMLDRLPEYSRYFFSIRNPIQRFNSAFYWRKQQGGEHFNLPWNAHESAAFSLFEDANHLAESLFEQSENGLKAAAAIKSIAHTSRNQIDNFSLCGNLFNVQPPLWIIRQERFDEDIRHLLSLLGVSEDFKMPEAQPSSRRQNYHDVPELSETAFRNLERWYSQDFEFIRLCEAWLSDKLRQAKHAP
ncbi:MAG: sulfotransferase family 2 domain-containing protein [Pseudomonadota bacterium]